MKKKETANKPTQQVVSMGKTGLNVENPIEPFSKLEPVNETAEQAAKKLAPVDDQDNPAYPNHTDTDIFISGFKEGAKWQQEQQSETFTLADMEICFEESRKGNIFNTPITAKYETFEEFIKSLKK